MSATRRLGDNPKAKCDEGAASVSPLLAMIALSEQASTPALRKYIRRGRPVAAGRAGACRREGLCALGKATLRGAPASRSRSPPPPSVRMPMPVRTPASPRTIAAGATPLGTNVHTRCSRRTHGRSGGIGRAPELRPRGCVRIGAASPGCRSPSLRTEWGKRALMAATRASEKADGGRTSIWRARRRPLCLMSCHVNLDAGGQRRSPVTLALALHGPRWQAVIHLGVRRRSVYVGRTPRAPGREAPTSKGGISNALCKDARGTVSR